MAYQLVWSWADRRTNETRGAEADGHREWKATECADNKSTTSAFHQSSIALDSHSRHLPHKQKSVAKVNSKRTLRCRFFNRFVVEVVVVEPLPCDITNRGELLDYAGSA